MKLKNCPWTKITILPFLNAKKSNTEWSKETTIVIARRYGFPSKNTLWENYQIKKKNILSFIEGTRSNKDREKKNSFQTIIDSNYNLWFHSIEWQPKFDFIKLYVILFQLASRWLLDGKNSQARTLRRFRLTKTLGLEVLRLIETPVSLTII